MVLVADVEVAVKLGMVRGEYRVDPAVAKFPTPCTEKILPGVVVPMPTFPDTVRFVSVVVPA